jgi:hypothetical protein
MNKTSKILESFKGISFSRTGDYFEVRSKGDIRQKVSEKLFSKGIFVLTAKKKRGEIFNILERYYKIK